MGTQDGMIQASEELRGDVLVVRLKGRLDVVAAQTVETKMLGIISGGQRKVIMNLCEVSYLSSAGIRVLLTVATKLKPISGRLIVCAVSANVLHILTVSGFVHVIEIAKNEEEAIQKFTHI